MEEAAECMLVLIGATPEGKKELVGFQTGVRESAQSWRELLVDIKQRGLEIAPDLAAGDGALGFWKAIEEVFPGTRHCGDVGRHLERPYGHERGRIVALVGAKGADFVGTLPFDNIRFH